VLTVTAAIGRRSERDHGAQPRDLAAPIVAMKRDRALARKFGDGLQRANLGVGPHDADQHIPGSIARRTSSGSTTPWPSTGMQGHARSESALW
jgi:hypothetical protein